MSEIAGHGTVVQTGNEMVEAESRKWVESLAESIKELMWKKIKSSRNSRLVNTKPVNEVLHLQSKM